MWFLRLGTPVFCGPLERLFNKSVTTSTIPKQWKVATIVQVPKIATLWEHADFQLISVKSFFSRALKRIIVQKFIYPALLELLAQLSYTDQYVFHPTGSTTAAVVAFPQSVTKLLSYNPYVVIIALDFSKAFDSVRHSTPLHKMASMNLPDEVYNRLNKWCLVCALTQEGVLCGMRIAKCKISKKMYFAEFHLRKIFAK